jgi:multidrug efflux pump subunit AcrB
VTFFPEEPTMRLVIPAVLILTCAIPAYAAPQTGVIRVTATYPGADARTVDETVLAPLFLKIAGVEGQTRIESEARNDGTGTVTVSFEPEADLNLAEVRVQNRVNLALAAVPAACRELGVSVRKFPAGPPTFLLALTSADDKHDGRFLGHYAMVHLKPFLAHVPGVADVRVVGFGEFAVRVLLNPDRLTAYKLTAGDVVGALRRQNEGVAAGAVGGAIRYTVTASAKLTTSDQFADVILRANAKGEVLKLRDVARVEIGSTMDGFARVNGKPAALIAVTVWTGRVTAKELLGIDGAEDLPPGVRLDVVADRTTDRLLEVGVQSPAASLELTEKIVGRATELIRGLPGKLGTVAFAEGRETNAATILVKAPAKDGTTAANVDKALDVIGDVAIRVGAVPAGGDGFPVRLALTDPGDRGEGPLLEAADRVGARLAKAPGVVNPGRDLGPATGNYVVNVDRDKCATLGVEFDDVFTTLRASLGGVQATDFSKFGRMWPVTVRADPRFTRQIEDLKLHTVRSAAGEMIPLEKVLAFRKAAALPAVVRVNGYRAIVFTASPAAGKTPAEAAALCVKSANEVLPKGYRMRDLTDPTR